MSTYDVIDANRKVKRDIQKVFGDDFLKIITEIILNSDDSYNRLADQDKPLEHTFGQISVKLNRRTRVLRFLDHAEGMSLLKMSELFSKYGGDYHTLSTTKNIRGLFGQGASDVLFLSAFHQFPSYIISIVDGKASKCSFIFEHQKKIHTQALLNVDKVRKETGIIKDGTLVVFGLPESVKIPKQKDIKEKIDTFYMLRYILSNENRQVVFFDDEIKHRLDASKQLFQSEPCIMNKVPINLSLDGMELNSYLTLYQTKPSDQRQIIIRDEYQVVYEESMFGLEKIHGTKTLAGEYVIEGIGHVLRMYLNKEKPEEILRDSRDGFDRRHRFTINMISEVTKILHQVIEQYSHKKEPRSFSLHQNEKLTTALHKTNEYFEDLSLSPIYEVHDQKLLEERLHFARNVITITEGKRYGLHLYINASETGVVKLDIENNPYITLTNKEISLQEQSMKQEGTIIKHVIIKALKKTTKPIVLKASTKTEETRVLIHVIKEKVVYPENGLAFGQKRKIMVPNRTSYIKLYFDTSYIPLKSSILINQHYESMLFPEAIEIYTKEEHMMTDTIGVIKVPIASHHYEERIALSATSYDIETKATCIIKARNNINSIAEGLINKIELVFEEASWQARMSEEEQTLQINGEHIINQKNLGSLKEKDPNNPLFDEKELHYLYELMALESSKQYVIDKYKNNQETIDPKRILEEIQEHKSKVYVGLLEKE
ncbi:MAG: hypothetical protein ACVCEJ_03595 [Candidatus Izemoplasmataceae bacterium]